MDKQQLSVKKGALAKNLLHISHMFAAKYNMNQILYLAIDMACFQVGALPDDVFEHVLDASLVILPHCTLVPQIVSSLLEKVSATILLTCYLFGRCFTEPMTCC